MAAAAEAGGSSSSSTSHITSFDSVAAAQPGASVVAEFHTNMTLAVAQGADKARLCRQYLVTAVRVHPAVNQHEDTTEAFIHAARYWLEFTGYTTANGSNSLFSPLPFIQDHMVNIELAYKAFECATTECMSYTDNEELAHVLKEAQCLVRNQQESDAWSGMRSAASGLAFSAGVWICGSAVSQSGWGVVGSLTRRMAMVQGIGQVASGSMAVLQHPDVREKVEAHVEPICTSIPSCSWSRSCSAFFPSSMSDMSICSNDLCNWLTGRGSDEEQLPVGCLVTITGLRNALELNGRNAMVVGLDEQSGRYQVRITSSEGNMGDHHRARTSVKLIKAENLLRQQRLVREPPRAVEQFI